uniref:Nucleotidyl transferase AbiEii/AbiGii toxin family protein n=1 Tax=candidate division WOR-3 bacterium TaxID=2052148 RepID=A0A7C4X9N4_UNCW3
MFEQVLTKKAKSNLALLGSSRLLKDAYLAGGTAVALQLGHRISIDFDFFTTKDFIPKVFSAKLSKLGAFKEEQADKGTVLGEFRGIRVSLFVYKYPLLFPALKYLSLNIADIRDIAAMKIDAIATRGLKRDFIDLYFICKSGYKLVEILKFYDKKYRNLASNLIHIKKSLVFFDDAESDAMPKMIKSVNWEEIKEYFEREVKKLVGI